MQIGECRSAFAGKVARDGTCSDSLDCQIGLRCLPITGSMTMTTCQPARGAQESCERSVECSDGFVCAGEGFSDPTPPRVCIPANLLRANNGACSFSFECIKDLVCRSEKCTTPTADAICTPS